MIGSGSTIAECKKAIETNGGKCWGICSTHALFVGKANENLVNVENIIITDTISSLWRLNNKSGTYVISTAKMFGQAIKRTFEDGGSISDLLK